MLSLDSQRSSFNIVISDLSRCNNSVAEICDKMSSLGLIYYACVHDKDLKEDGTKKLTHLHIVICSMKRLRVKQCLRYFEDICSTNIENIQIQENLSIVSSVQYLLHINDVNKYQYDRKELLTNQPSNADALLIESPKSNELTTQQLFDFIFKDKMNRLELINAIGIGKYQHYRQTINDIYEFTYQRRKS